MVSSKFLPHFPELLSVDNAFYAKMVNAFFENQLALDNAYGLFDFCDQDLFVDLGFGEFVVTAREDFVISGLEELVYVFSGFDTSGFKFKFLVSDGESVVSGQNLIFLSGKVRNILFWERCVLNFLSRMSGVTTVTVEFLKKANGFLVASTRKTVWPLLDKKAVSVGGGLTHRLSRSQALMIKDNELLEFMNFVCASSFDLEDFIKKIVGMPFIEIEVDSLEQLVILLPFINAYSSYSDNSKPHLGILLDNFVQESIFRAISLLPRSVFIEVSGGIDMQNLENWLIPGVDFVSVGSLTKSAVGVDLALDRIG